MHTAEGLLAGAGRRFDIPLLAAGLALHLVADVVRNGGWLGVIRAASPAHRDVRLRDVQAAAFAGGGVSCVVPARGGDVVKVALIRRRVPGARVPTLVATFVPETLFEFLVGFVLLGWALSQGYLPVDVVTDALGSHPALAGAIAAGACAGLCAACVVLRRRAAGIYADLVAGFGILRRPQAFVARVASWQIAGRVIRLGAIACCLSACRLPGGAGAAALAMAVDGGTRVHFAPATAGLRVGLLVYGLPAVTGSAVSVGAVLVYLAVVRSLRTIMLLVIAVGVLAAALGTRSPRRALRAVRRLGGAAAEPLAPEVEPLAAKAPVGSA